MASGKDDTHEFCCEEEAVILAGGESSWATIALCVLAVDVGRMFSRTSGPANERALTDVWAQHPVAPENTSLAPACGSNSGSPCFAHCGKGVGQERGHLLS